MSRKRQKKREDSNQAPPEKKSNLIWLASFLVLAGAGIAWWMMPGLSGEAKAGEVVVYKSPTCGCCKDWVKYMREEGFSVATRDMPDVDPIKDRYKVPYNMGSCHTAVVDGYVVEGHVPAKDIKRMLTEKPAITGIAAPGMPNGAPGMLQAGPKDRYDIIAFSPKGNDVYASY